MARNSTERCGGEYDLESKGRFLLHTQQESTQLPQASTKSGMMLVSKGMVFLRDPLLFCCNSYMNESNFIRKFSCFNLAHSSCYLQLVLVQGGLPARTRA